MFTLSSTISKRDQVTVDKAVTILEKQAKKVGKSMAFSATAKQYLHLKLGALRREHFAIMYLDSGLRLIQCDIEFAGSIEEVPVKPLEIARKALTLASTHVILAHNHPSGILEASNADIHVTRKIQDVLNPFEITVCDHIIASASGTLSFVDEGLL